MVISCQRRAGKRRW